MQLREPWIPLLLLCVILAFAFPVTSWGRVPGDFADDALITSGSSPSIVDVIDFMIWNHFKFTLNPNGHLVGDETNDGNVDGQDLTIWQAFRFNSDLGGSAGCDASTTACVSDAEYLTALTSAPRNIPDLSSSAMAPVFTTDPSFTNLVVTIQPNTFLQAFTVLGPEATGFGADYADNSGSFPSFTNGAGVPTFVHSTYYHGREQWYAFYANFINNGGWDQLNNGIVASFPTGSLVGSSILWQIQPGLDSNDHYFGLQVVSIPEPNADFNHDGVVDAADYVVWRKDPGSFGGQQSYDDWRSNFGNGAGSGGESNNVPEPSTFAHFGVVLLSLCASRRVKRR